MTNKPSNKEPRKIHIIETKKNTTTKERSSENDPHLYQRIPGTKVEFNLLSSDIVKNKIIHISPGQMTAWYMHYMVKTSLVSH